MTNQPQQQPPPSLCEKIRMAAMAHLDGEPLAGLITLDEIERHVAGCQSCAAAIAELQALHSDLPRALLAANEPRLDVDLWPAVGRTITPTKDSTAATTTTLIHGTPPRERGSTTILALAGLMIAWRLAQLLFDLPGPITNSVVPLAVIVVLIRRLASGDPFAIQSSVLQMQQKGAS